MSEANASPLPRPLLAGPVCQRPQGPSFACALALDLLVGSTSTREGNHAHDRTVPGMAKVIRTVKSFGSATNNVTNPAVLTLGAHGGPHSTSDTLVRSIFSVHLTVVTDDTVNPPPYEWFQSARCVFAAAFSAAGTATLPTSENDASLKGRVMLYPELWYSDATNALHGVQFRPRADTIQFRTQHKGDGVHTPSYAFGLYLHDSSGVLTNPGGLYSVVKGFAFYATTMWASDT